jgi:hypothetical protein
MHTLETHAQRIETMYRASTGLQPSIALRARRDAPIIATQDRKLTSSSTASTTTSIGSIVSVTATAVNSSEHTAAAAAIHVSSIAAGSSSSVRGSVTGTVTGASNAVNGSCSGSTESNKSEAMAVMAQQVQTMAVALEVSIITTRYTVCVCDCILHSGAFMQHFTAVAAAGNQ